MSVSEITTGAAPTGAERASAVRVRAPGRLHLGFLDLSGGLGRRFGSLGLSLDEPATVLRARRADRRSVSGPDAERAEAALVRVAEALGVSSGIELTVEAALPTHAGLGSGTQLGLAVGAAVARLGGLRFDPGALGDVLGRGARSSIGLAAFRAGGVILDGGRGPADRAPPVIAQLPVPERWRIILIFDDNGEGVSGAAEKAAMEGLPAFPEALAERLCRIVLMRALPAVAEGDAERFGEAVGEIQHRIGDHFAAAQGGRFTSSDVGEALAFIEREGIPGIGQSSWGPTGFAIVGERVQAERLTGDLRRRFADRANLHFRCVRGNNRGAGISTETIPARAATAVRAGE